MVEEGLEGQHVVFDGFFDNVGKRLAARGFMQDPEPCVLDDLFTPKLETNSTPETKSND